MLWQNTLMYTSLSVESFLFLHRRSNASSGQRADAPETLIVEHHVVATADMHLTAFAAAHLALPNRDAKNKSLHNCGEFPFFSNYKDVEFLENDRTRPQWFDRLIGFCASLTLKPLAISPGKINQRETAIRQ